MIVHQDAEIVDPDFLAKIREALSDPDVALVGCAGAVDVRSIAWWEGSVTWASFTHRFDEYGGGDIPALSWIPEQIPVYAETGEVDTIDGFVIAFSPWAIENLRFDETIGGVLHGYDFDICMQARAAGKKVVTADLRVIHHHSLVLISSVDTLDGSAHQAGREVARPAARDEPRLAPPRPARRGRAGRDPAQRRRRRADLGTSLRTPRGGAGADQGEPELATHQAPAGDRPAPPRREAEASAALPQPEQITGPPPGTGSIGAMSS